MKEARIPPYFAVSGECADMAQYFQDDQRLTFYDGLYKDYDHLRKGEPLTDYPHDLVGEISRKAQTKMSEAYESYLRRVNSNPTGKNQHSKPPPGEIKEAYTSDGEAYTSPMADFDLNIINHNQLNRNQSESINQIKSNLYSRGFEPKEIETALKKANGRKIRPDGLEKYLITVMENERTKRKGKTVTAQQYTQREYEPRTPEEEAKHADDMLDKLEEITGTAERGTE